MNSISPSRRLITWLSLALVLITMAIYGQIIEHDFINFDDNLYVYENEHVTNGWNLQNFTWAFSSSVAANWHPITMLSHMMDVQIFKLNPGGHHFTNLVFHLLNTLLLFWLLSRITRRTVPSALVAALFALHPAHVESVAWVAERKDVLSTFFWLITMLFYARFTEDRTYLNYSLSLIFFTIGLMAKPMLVTLPFVLLLFDYWPLGRMKIQKGDVGIQASDLSDEPLTDLVQPPQSIFRLVFEKTPYFLIVVLFCIIAFKVQQNEGAVAPVDIIPLQSRILNALVSYGIYILKMAWPFNLSVFYPFPEIIPLWQPMFAAALIISFSLTAFIKLRRSPWLLVGWCWYLGTLVPVIGLVQIGSQAMADRYTYIPFIGLFTSLVWELDLWLKNSSFNKKIATILGLILFGCLLPLTWLQIRHWRNSIDLYEHALKTNGNNAVVQNLIGLAKLDQNRTEEAILHFAMAVGLKPDNGKPFNNLGIALFREGKLALAEEAFLYAIQSMPNLVDAYINMGVVQSELGNFDLANTYFQKALTISPFHAKAHYNAAISYEKQKQPEKAIYHYKQAMKHNPKLMANGSKRIQQLNIKK